MSLRYRFPSAFALAFAVALVAALPARAADRTWDGGGDGATWSDALNWSGDAVPGGGDRALVAGASVRLTGPAAAQALVLSAGAALDATGFVLTLGTGPSIIAAGTVLTIGGVAAGTSDALVFDGPVAVEGRLDWTGGQVRTDAYYVPPGGKVLTVAPGGTLRWLGAADRTLSAALVNDGTLRWEGGRTLYSQGYSFASAGTIDAVLGSDAELRGVGINSAGPWRLANTGTVRKSGAGTLTLSNVELQTVGGTIDVRVGTLDLQASSRHENATVAVAAGATYLLGGVTQGNGVWHEIAGTVAGAPAGAFVVDTGGWASGLAAAPAGGVLDIGGTGLQVRHANVGGRFVNNANEPAPVNRGLVRFVDAPDNRISGLFRNEGTVRWEAGRVLLPVGGRFESPGVFEIDLTADAEWLGGSAPLTVSGTLRALGPATATLRSRLDVTAGTVDVRAGTLVLDLGSRWEDAAVAVALGATLRLAGNRGFEPHVVAGTLAGTPAGTFVVTSASYAVLLGDPGRPGVLNVGGTGVQMDNGYLGGGFGDFEPYPAPRNAGLLRFVGGAQRFIERPFVNSGAVRWEAGQIFQRASAPVTNRGVWTFAAGAAEWTGLNGATFTNEGTLRAETAVRMVVALVNRGGLDVGAGTVAVLSGGAFENAFGGAVWGTGTLDLSALNPAVVLNSGSVSPGAAADGAGVGTLTLRGTLALEAVTLDVGGASPGLFDRIVVESGPSQIAASSVVVVRPSGGFVPLVGQTFAVVTGPTTGAFGSVVSAVPGLAFTATYPAGGGAVLTAGPGGPAGTFSVGPDSTVSSAYRTLILSGATFAAGATVRLACTVCLDAAAHGAIPGEVTDRSGGLLRVRFDLRSPRVIGAYDVVVEGPGQAAIRAPLWVNALLSVPIFDARNITGIVVRPAPLLSWGTVNVYAATNNPGSIVTMVRFQPEVPDPVRITVNSAYHGFGTPLFVHNESPEPGLFVFRIRQNRAAPLSIGTGINPGDVDFPAPLAGPAPAARGGGTVPFGGDFAFSYHGDQHQTQDLLAENTAQAFINSDNAALNDYAQNLVPGDLPASLGRLHDAIRETMDALPSGAALTPRELMDRVLDRLQDTNPQPPGLRDGAAQDFEDTLDENFRESERESTEAFREALGPTAPDAVRDGTRSDLDALRANAGGRDADDPFNEKPPPGTVDPVLQTLEEIFDQPPGTPLTPQEQEVLYRITAPWDPNDKTTDSQAYTCELGFVTVDGAEVPRCVRYLVPEADAAAPIPYTVHFENKALATAPAEDVVIADTLDARLDPATFRLTGSSSDSTLTVSVVGQVVTFRFTGIHLVPNVTAPEGQGYVSYTVAPRPGWPAGAPIRNRASIVFDFNPAILTPTVEHVRQGPAGGVLPDGLALDGVFPNPVETAARVRVGMPVAGDAMLAVFDLRGREVRRLMAGPLGAGWHDVPFDARDLSSGVYVVQFQSGGRAVARTLTVLR